MPTAKPTGSEPTTTKQTNTRHSESGWHPNHTRTISATSSSSTTSHTSSTTSDSDSSTPEIDIANYPSGKMSLSGISLRAMLLGTTLGLTTSLTLLLATTSTNPLWRVPFFIAALSLFHFLEFWVTARYNTRYATVSAFLLSSNGWAYNVAHGSAVVECLVSHTIWPGQSRIARMLSVPEPFFGEEAYLISFFGDAYVQYRKDTPVGIPGI
ncbi:hypothetical protein PENANT_c001G03777 [Penicillium antarcticum]|uniref:Protein-S-isoprenylcysteine O-methyltransferase n=1 Tax=Penicillium antarcticum TaxID=416450 RepID=A0A1V6QPI2_9EURO|nr:hypothetical protein PENANT_c001G03777 [Penicillium antarcticum]